MRVVPPSLFVPLLERSGAIVDVGEWVLRQAASDMQTWTKAGLTGVRVAVNVSPLQLRRRDFVERVLSGIASAAKHTGGIDVEITESMLMQDLDLSIRKLEQLREAGIGVAIDDFGTGYSSLARAFGMSTVAEGVETLHQLDMVRISGCDQAQGYLFARPNSAAEIPIPEIGGINRSAPKSSLLNRNLGDGDVRRPIIAIASQCPEMHGVWRGRDPVRAVGRRFHAH